MFVLCHQTHKMKKMLFHLMSEVFEMVLKLLKWNVLMGKCVVSVDFCIIIA